MAGRIKIEPYKPLDTSTSPVPGGGYIDVDASVGKFGPSPLTQFGLQAAEGVAAIATTATHHLAPDNEAVVKAADTRLSETEQALLFDPRTGHLNRQGQDALTQAPAVLEAYRAAQDRELAATANDDQHHMLRQLNERRLASFSTVVERHAAAERQRWHDAAGDRRIALMRADAALHWSDDALLRRALGTVRAEVREKAERHPWDSALTEATLSRETSRTLASAIEAAVERDPERAQSLRMRYDQHIEAPDRAALDALLAEAQTRQRAQRASAEILNSTPPDGQAPTLTWQLQQAESIAEPAVRAAAVRSLHAAAAAAEGRARAQAEQVLARVLKDGLTDPSQIPLREWVALDPERRQAIETRLDHNAAGTEPAANPALIDELATQMTEAPSVFARRDLVLSIAHHPLPQWQRFRDLQAGLRRNDPATEDEIRAIKRGLQLANKMLPADTPDDVATNYRAELVDEIGTWRRLSGKSPDDADIAAMLRRVELPPIDYQLLQSGMGRPPARGRFLTLQQRSRFDQYSQGLWRVRQYNRDYTEFQGPHWVPSRQDITRINQQAEAYARIHQFFQHHGIALRSRDYEAIRQQELRGATLQSILGSLGRGQTTATVRPRVNDYGRPAPGVNTGEPTGRHNRPSSESEIVPGWQFLGQVPAGSVGHNQPPRRRASVAPLDTNRHHSFPQQWWNPERRAPFPFSLAARNFFDSKIIEVMRNEHWNRDHSKYNERIGIALNEYLKRPDIVKRGITPQTMTREQAEELYDAVVTSNPDPFVQDHLSKMLESASRVTTMRLMRGNIQ
ncbi:MAG: hypothetical protein KF889_27825 [Alphaproteobacteria bacterium]|nr:hypothetical protein [Alphaproteobacteria bacterium]MCW5743765.1 hypothetical protein [Alphaproteobacteria bacterium]